MVECSIMVPEDLKEIFIEMTPIFKNIEVGRENISDYMKNIAETQGFLPRPRRCLIGSYFGEKIAGYTTFEMVLGAGISGDRNFPGH